MCNFVKTTSVFNKHSKKSKTQKLIKNTTEER